TGIVPVGDIPWGTHVCLFHQTTRDLLAALAQYFKAGLEDNEFCLWVLDPALTEQEARGALRQAVPDLDRHLESRSIEFLPHEAWYLSGGVFDLQRVVAGWQRKLDQVMPRGYSGIRVTGSTAWLHRRDWRDFREYEDAMSQSIANRR